MKGEAKKLKREQRQLELLKHFEFERPTLESIMKMTEDR